MIHVVRSQFQRTEDAVDAVSHAASESRIAVEQVFDFVAVEGIVAR